jgi:TolB-like protein
MKRICIALLCCLTGFGAFAQNVTLDEAIRSIASEMGERLPQGGKVAVLSFTSMSDQLSGYVIDEVNNAVVNEGKLTVVDRQQLDLIMQEMEFQMSGLVGDESAQAIGRMLGAQYIVSGSLESIAGSYRFRIRALVVENATIAYSSSRNVVSDRTITSLARGGGGEISGDFTAAERNRARWLNIFWGAGSFSQRDILGGTITGLLEVGGLVCIGIGMGVAATQANYSDAAFDYHHEDNTWILIATGQSYNTYTQVQAARDAYNDKKITTSSILMAGGAVLGTAGIIYGFIRPSAAHRPGYAAGSPADPANWNIALVPDNRGNTAFRLAYTMNL